MAPPKVDAYRLLPRARADLADIWTFTAHRWSVEQADTYAAGLTRECAALVAFPVLARERREFDPPVRIRHYQSHLIVYGIVETDIVVIRILHGNRDWQTIIEDEA